MLVVLVFAVVSDMILYKHSSLKQYHADGSNLLPNARLCAYSPPGGFLAVIIWATGRE